MTKGDRVVLIGGGSTCALAAVRLAERGFLVHRGQTRRHRLPERLGETGVVLLLGGQRVGSCF